MRTNLQCRWFGDLSYLPITLVILLIACFLTSYSIARVQGDIPYFLPYISDTGAEQPESCFFGQFLNMAAAVCAFGAFVRYKILKEYVVRHQVDDKSSSNMIVISFVLATASSFGISVVANFQKDVAYIHYPGAVIAFLFGSCFILGKLQHG